MPKLCSLDIEHRKEIYKRLEKFIRQLKQNFPIKEIYLYGSLAKDEIHEGSDIDLIIVGDFKGRMFERIEEILKVTDLPIEPLCYTPAEFEKMKKGGSYFIKEVLVQAKKL